MYALRTAQGPHVPALSRQVTGAMAAAQAQGGGRDEQQAATPGDGCHHAGHRDAEPQGESVTFQLPSCLLCCRVHSELIQDNLRDCHTDMSLQDMIAGLCESYGSVISLVVYVGVLAGDVFAHNVIANSISAVQAEFNR